MAVIYFISAASGKKYAAEGKPGQTLMEVAVAHQIPGIAGECGGVCACGTCHIYWDKAAEGLAVPADIHEEDILSLLDGVKPSSRLACQIALTEKMDGICVYLP